MAPSGDQPKAIEKLVQGINHNESMCQIRKIQIIFLKQ
jgi:excinuclease UvrABC helicase subunit UvrB